MSDPVENSAIARMTPPPPAEARRSAIAGAERRARMLVPIAGGYREIPVVSVDARDLVYRSANGRIVTELEQHVARSGGSIAALHANETAIETQALLHGLLVAKASSADGPVMQELARHGRQTEPLLVTADGVLVNGNRRLAAMRELTARDPARYAAFAQVDAGVLPDDIGVRDIEFIEAALQMAPEVKLAYGWINRRMKLRHQHETLGLSADAIADAYRMESVDRVATEIDELRLAEAYLAMFGDPADYAALADLEPLFTSLHAQLAMLPDELRDAWRIAGFAMIDGRAAIDAPMDRFFPFAPPNPATLPAWTLRRLAEEEGIAPLVDGQRSSARNIDLPPGIVDRVARQLADPARTRPNAASLFGLMEQLRAEHADSRAPHNAVKLVGRARAAIAGIEVGRMSTKQLRQLRSEMVALEASVATLLGETPAIPATAPPQPGILQRLFGTD